MPESPLKSSRRGFAKVLAAAAVSPALLPVATAAPPAPAPVPAPAPGPVPTPSPAPEAPSSAAEALTEVARLRWGRHLSGEELGKVAKAIDGRLRGADAMRKVPLSNADEPDVVFSAGPGEVA